MRLVVLLRNLIAQADLQKLQNVNWTFPSFEKILPHYLAIMSGFVLSSLTGFIAAFLLMPKPVPMKAVTATDSSDGSGGVTLPPKARESDFTFIFKRNVFDSAGTVDDGTQKAVCELVKSQLPLKFTGIIYGGTPETSLILLESVASKESDTFLLNDTVPGDARIVGIERQRVIFERNSCREYLDLEEPPPLKKRVAGAKPVRPVPGAGTGEGGSYREDGFEREGTVVKATKQWVEKAVTVDFTKTLQDAKASPNMVNGEVKGFVLTRIRPDSVYEKMGLKDGDVVEAINGIELNDAARAIQTLNAMRNESNLDLQYKRNGQVQTLKVQVK